MPTHRTTTHTRVANSPTTPNNRRHADFDRALKGFVPGQAGLLTELVDREIYRLAADALLGRRRKSRIGAWAYRQFLAPDTRVPLQDYTVLTAARLHEIADRHGANALHAAVESFSVEVVKIVLATGNVRGGLQATDRNGLTPGELAVQLTLPSIFRHFLPMRPRANYVQSTFGPNPAAMKVLLTMSGVPVVEAREIITAFVRAGVNLKHGDDRHQAHLALLREFHPSLSPLLDAPAA